MGISSFVQLGNGWAGVYESAMAEGNLLSRTLGHGGLGTVHWDMATRCGDTNHHQTGNESRSRAFPVRWTFQK